MYVFVVFEIFFGVSYESREQKYVNFFLLSLDGLWRDTKKVCDKLH